MKFALFLFTLLFTTTAAYSANSVFSVKSTDIKDASTITNDYVYKTVLAAQEIITLHKLAGKMLPKKPKVSPSQFMTQTLQPEVAGGTGL
jgi:hypothetical protein